MRRLDTAADGRHFAVDVLSELREAGSERCRANLPAYLTLQSDALILALFELKERGTVEAVAGFGQIMTDAIGTRSGEPMPEIYEAMERAGVIRRYKFKRAVNRGHRIAVPALWRERNADRIAGPDALQGDPAPNPQQQETAEREPLCAADLNGP